MSTRGGLSIVAYCNELRVFYAPCIILKRKDAPPPQKKKNAVSFLIRCLKFSNCKLQLFVEWKAPEC